MPALRLFFVQTQKSWLGRAIRILYVWAALA